MLILHKYNEFLNFFQFLKSQILQNLTHMKKGWVHHEDRITLHNLSLYGWCSKYVKNLLTLLFPGSVLVQNLHEFHG